MMYKLARINFLAVLNKGNMSPLSDKEILDNYRCAKPILDSFKKGEAKRPELEELYEFYTVASFISDQLINQTVESARGLIQDRKQKIFDAGQIILAFINSDIEQADLPKMTGALINTVHDGYIAACEVIENCTISAYYSAIKEILTLELVAEKKRLGVKNKIRIKKRRKK